MKESDIGDVMMARSECEKAARDTFWKTITIAVTIILGLVGTLWGITYGNLSKEVNTLKTSNIEIQKFVAAQAEINRSTNETLRSLLGKMDAVVIATGARVKEER